MREKLIEIVFKSLCNHIHKSCKLAENIADDLIANDVVPVVRCKDCKASSPYENRPSYLFCMENFRVVDNDDFCSYGRKERQ